jgi:glucose/arabinose dehydrogenase
VRVQGGRPVSSEDFVSGWQRSNGARWGRPVAVLVAADGALLVSDDFAGRIWRVTYGH